MKKYYISGIVAIVLVAGACVYFQNSMTCYDGYGSSRYVTKSSLTTRLNSAGPGLNEWDIMASGLNEIAVESFRCGDSDYTIKDGDNFREVSGSNFEKFIDGKSELYRVTQSGNSPYIINDATTGREYFIDQKDGKYVLAERKRL